MGWAAAEEVRNPTIAKRREGDDRRRASQRAPLTRAPRPKPSDRPRFPRCGLLPARQLQGASAIAGAAAGRSSLSRRRRRKRSPKAPCQHCRLRRRRPCSGPPSPPSELAAASLGGQSGDPRTMLRRILCVAAALICHLNVCTGYGVPLEPSQLPRGPSHAEHDSINTCDLCADNWLFIIGAGGRTGSTTALSMFRGIPGFEIAGEHWGMLKQFLEAFKLLRDTEEVMYDPAWVGRKHDGHALRCNVQHFVKTMLLGKDFDLLSQNTTVIGFKEIRYANYGMLRFLSRTFPCVRIIFTYRKDIHVDIRAFEFTWTGREEWDRGTRVVQDAHLRVPGQTALLAVEDFNIEHFNDIMHNFLGVRSCNYTKVIHDNANGSYSHDPNKGSGFLEGHCDLSRVNFRLGPEEIERNLRAWSNVQDDPKVLPRSDVNLPPQPQRIGDDQEAVLGHQDDRFVHFFHEQTNNHGRAKGTRTAL